MNSVEFVDFSLCSCIVSGVHFTTSAFLIFTFGSLYSCYKLFSNVLCLFHASFLAFGGLLAIFGLF